MRDLLTDPEDIGLARLVERLRGADPAASRLNRQAWLALLDDASLAADALEAVVRSGVLASALAPPVRMLVQDLVSALGRWRYEPARPLLLRLWREPGELALRAGQALLAFGDRDALDAVAAPLEVAEGGPLRLAIQAALTRAPDTAWEVLAPRFASPSPRGGAVLDATLHVLLTDLSDDGRAHWGASRRWFYADPRWLDLCHAWKQLPPEEARERWGPQQAQRIVDAAAWLRKRPA